MTCPYGDPVDCYFCVDKDSCDIWLESDAKALYDLINNLKRAGWTAKDLKEQMLFYYFG